MLLDRLVACLKQRCLSYSKKGFLLTTVIRGRPQIVLAGHTEMEDGLPDDHCFLFPGIALYGSSAMISASQTGMLRCLLARKPSSLWCTKRAPIFLDLRELLWRWQPARVECALVARFWVVWCLQKWEMVGAALCQTQTVPTSSHISTEPCSWAGSTSGKLSKKAETIVRERVTQKSNEPQGPWRR